MVLRWIRGVWENPAYRFVIMFALLLGAMSLAYPAVTKRWFFLVSSATRFTARVEYWMLRPFTEEATVDGNMVYLGGFSVRIIEECTGAFEAIIFLAAVLAFPTSGPRKAVGIALGVPILYAFNILRILVLILVGRHAPAVFEFMHVYFWQATLIIMITSVWLLWIFKVVRYEKKVADRPA